MVRRDVPLLRVPTTPVLADAGCHLKAEARQFRRHDGRRALLLEQHFGVGVEVLPDGGELGQVFLQTVFDHLRRGTFLSRRAKAQTVRKVKSM